MHSGASTSSNKVVATLRIDGTVQTAENTAMLQLANLINYKIKTEADNVKPVTQNYNPPTMVDYGKQLLSFARDSDVQGVKHALSRGAPYTTDWLGMSALHFAALNNQLELCEILLHGGINKDARTKVDRTPLHVACYYGHEEIAELLLSKKCLVNPRDMLRMTPLHWAVQKGHKAVVRLLLRYNADVTAVSKFGQTAVALAVITEQADILEELKTAKQMQTNRKLNEEVEKETNDAINSIMDSAIMSEHDALSSNDAMDAMEVDNNIDILEKLGNSHKILGSNALQLLKTHGISMMDEDNGASQEMLNNVLQNGRQLVLSEGGRLLLHETQGKHINSTNLNNTSNNRNNINDKTNNCNNKITINNAQMAAKTKATEMLRVNNVKLKQSPPAVVTKNKNIRIISLNDFKKLCADNTSNTVQKIPSSLASSRVLRQFTDGTKLVNMRHLQSRKLKLPSINDASKSNLSTTTNTTAVKIIKEEVNAPEEPSPKRPFTATATATPTTARFIPSNRIDQMGTVHTIQLKPPASSGNTTAINKPIMGNTRISNNYGESSQKKLTSILPLLTPPEICRQLMELRRQNDELRRKFELAQKEKEEMRQRLDKVEEILYTAKI